MNQGSELLLITLVVLWATLASGQKGNPFDDLDASRSVDSVLLSYMNEERHEVQISFAYLDEDGEVVRHTYGPVNEQYFYPASTVKMVVAALALEKLHCLGIEGLTVDCPMQTFAGRPVQTADFLDPESPSGYRTIDEYIHQIFIASDNEAYNRLYEFLGVDYINRRLGEMGYEARIVHRLSAPEYNVQENLYTNPVRFYDQKGDILYHHSLVKSKGAFTNRLYDLPGQQKGRAYFDVERDRIVPLAFDFSQKNAMGLDDFQRFLMAIVMPEVAPKDKQIKISEANRKRLWKHMGSWPSESHRPSYQDLAPDYVKFFLADLADTAHIRMLNKVGYAYGTLTDVSYIMDSQTKRSYFLAATILVNKNGVFNDNVYEYDTDGEAFFHVLSTYIRNWAENKGLKTSFPKGFEQVWSGELPTETH